MASTARTPLCAPAGGPGQKTSWRSGSEQPPPLVLSPLPCSVPSPVSLPISVLSSRAEPLACPPAPVWLGQDRCSLQPPLTPPTDLTINSAPPPPAACLWGGKGEGRAAVCTLDPLPSHPHLSPTGPSWWEPPLWGHRLLCQRGLLCPHPHFDDGSPRPREGQGAPTGEPSPSYSPTRSPRTELKASWGPPPVQRIPQVLGVLGWGSLTPSREAQGGIDSLMGSLVGPPHPGVTPSVPWGAATWKKKGSAGTPHFLECLCPHLCHLGDGG